jgi:mRNA interferase MazF
MVERPYVPGTGDIVWLTFTPQAGHEQAGRRPALVLSPRSYNEKTSLALFCPITSRIKGYPFEVALPPAGAVTGVILADQIKSLDWRARRTRFASRASSQVIGEVLEKLTVLLDQGQS